MNSMDSSVSFDSINNISIISNASQCSHFPNCLLNLFACLKWSTNKIHTLRLVVFLSLFKLWVLIPFLPLLSLQIFIVEETGSGILLSS